MIGSTKKLMEKIKLVAPSLRDDICRCHDHECPMSEQCRRYLQRDRGGVRVAHAASLRNGEEDCKYLIETVWIAY